MNGSIYSIPFNDESQDILFSNAVFQHLDRPVAAMREMSRVVRQNGLVALRVPDWSGLLMHPATNATKQSIAQFLNVHYGPGKDPCIGCKLPSMLPDAELELVAFSVSHEVNDAKQMLCNISKRLKAEGLDDHAMVLEDAAKTQGAIFVQAWCEVLANKIPA